MSILSYDNRRSFAGDGITTTFAFPLPFTATTDLKVVLRAADGTELVQNPGADFSAGGAGSPTGGSVTLTVAPAAGTTLVIIRDPPLIQPLTLLDGGPLPTGTLNGAFDRLTMLCQRLFELVSRAPRLRETDVQGSGKLDAGNNEVINAVAGGLSSSLATVGQVQAMALASGNVPAPVGGDINRALVATGIGLYGWNPIAPAMLSAGAPSWTTSGSFQFQYNANAIAEIRAGNLAIGAVAQARFIAATGTANAFVAGAVIDNNGAPFWQQSCGSAILSCQWNGPVFAWQNTAGSTVWMQRNAGNLALPNGGLTALTVNTGALVVTSQNGGAIAGTRNRLANGNFAINQRGYTSGASLAAGIYGFDRWKAGSGGATLTFTAAKPDTLVTLTAGTLIQIVEDVNVEGGGSVLSWTGTAQARVGTGGAAPSGAYAASPLVIAAAAGQTISVEFNTGSLGTVQLEPGPVATPFERESFSAQLERCQRYYEKSFPLATAPAQNAGTAGAHSSPNGVAASLTTNLAAVQFKARKRAVPTVTLYNPAAANAQIRNVTASTDYTLSTATLIAENGFGISGTTPAAATAGQQAAVHWTADAEL